MKNYLKGYRLSSRHLLLSQSGLFCLSPQQGQKTQEEPKERNLIAKLRFSCSMCYIARDSYWEHITHYPTTNLIEVYKIVQAEIIHISPIKGQTYAYIIHLSNNKTTVLYCCFPEEIITAAKSFHLWRLLPETLAYYRYLHGKNGVYLSKLSLLTLSQSSLNIKSKENDFIRDEEPPCSELLIKIDNDICSSLPVDNTNLDMFSVAMMEEATVIKKNETEIIFNKFAPLNVLDFSVQAIKGITNLANKKGYLARYLATAFIAFSLTFIIGKSAFITWHNNHLTEQVAESKSIAVDSLKLSNKLKKIKSDISKINAALGLQVSKAQLLKILSGLVTEDNELKFSVVDILPTEMQLRGTIKNAATLLTALSNINGFNQVEFNSPPATLKQGGERFFITLHFDENVKQYQEKNKELAQ